MSPSRKKVIVRRMAGDFLAGYLAPNGFVRRIAVYSDADEHQRTAALDLLDLDGRTVDVPLVEVRMVCFVREFNRGDTKNPERLSRRSFFSRPRGKGLWLRVNFADGETLEGLAQADLTLLDGLLEDAGLFLTPPDDRANTHHIYVPRAAIDCLEVLGAIGTAQRKARAGRSQADDTDQATLFQK